MKSRSALLPFIPPPPHPKTAPAQTRRKRAPARWKHCAALLALLGAAQIAHGAATLPTYDGINFPAGYDLGGQSVTNTVTTVFEWTHIGIVAGQTTTINVGSGNLIYPGLGTSIG